MPVDSDRPSVVTAESSEQSTGYPTGVESAPRPENYGGPQPVLPPTVEDLSRQVKSLRTWLIVLTVVIVLLPLASCTASCAVPLALSGVLESQQPEDASTTIATDVREAFGGQLQGLSVTREKGGAPFFSDEVSEPGYLVKYTAPDTTVTIQGTVLDPYSLQESGIVPVRWNGMGRRELANLARAWAAETPSAMGPVYPWVETADDQDEEVAGSSSIATVTVQGASFSAGDLWVVFDGTAAADGTGSDSPLVRVFRIDRATGAASFVGWSERSAPF